MEAQQLFALVAWLQTFPEFDIQLYNGNESTTDADRLKNRLKTPEVSQYVWKWLFGCVL